MADENPGTVTDAVLGAIQTAAEQLTQFVHKQGHVLNAGGWEAVGNAVERCARAYALATGQQNPRSNER